MKTLTKTTLVALGAVVAFGAADANARIIHHHHSGYYAAPSYVVIDEPIVYGSSYGYYVPYGYYQGPLSTISGGIASVLNSL